MPSVGRWIQRILSISLSTILSLASIQTDRSAQQTTRPTDLSHSTTVRSKTDARKSGLEVSQPQSLSRRAARRRPSILIQRSQIKMCGAKKNYQLNLREDLWMEPYISDRRQQKKRSI